MQILVALVSIWFSLTSVLLTKTKADTASIGNQFSSRVSPSAASIALKGKVVGLKQIDEDEDLTIGDHSKGNHINNSEYNSQTTYPSFHSVDDIQEDIDLLEDEDDYTTVDDEIEMMRRSVKTDQKEEDDDHCDDNNDDDDDDYHQEKTQQLEDNNGAQVERIAEETIIVKEETLADTQKDASAAILEDDVAAIVKNLWRSHLLPLSHIMQPNLDPIFANTFSAAGGTTSNNSSNAYTLSLYQQFFEDLVNEFRDPIYDSQRAFQKSLGQHSTQDTARWFTPALLTSNKNNLNNDANVDGNYDQGEVNGRSLLTLRGTAILALYPAAVGSAFGGILAPRFQRGISLSLPPLFFPPVNVTVPSTATDSPSSTRNQQLYISQVLTGLFTRAFAVSCQSDLLVLNEPLVRSIADTASLQLRHKFGSSVAQLPSISTTTVLRHLFALLQEEQQSPSSVEQSTEAGAEAKAEAGAEREREGKTARPVTVVLQGEMRDWLLSDASASHLLLQQFKPSVVSSKEAKETLPSNHHNKRHTRWQNQWSYSASSPPSSENKRPVFFLNLAPSSSKSTVKSSINSPRPSQQQQQQQPQQQQSVQMPPFPMSGGPFPPTGMSGMVFGPFPPGFVPNMPMPPMPPSSAASAQSPRMMMSSRAFQVIMHRNGSMTMQAVPSPPGTPQLPPLPEHVMRQIAEDQQRFLQQMQQQQQQQQQQQNQSPTNRQPFLRKPPSQQEEAEDEDEEDESSNNTPHPNMSPEEMQESLRHLLEDPEALKSAMEAALQAMNKMTQAQPNHPRYQPKSSRKQHRGAGRVPFTRTPLPTSRVQPNTNSHHNNDNSNSNDSRAPFAADHSAAAIRDSDALPKSSSMSASGKALWTWFEQLSLHIPASPASASGVTADAVSTQWIKLLTVHVTDRRWQDNVAVLQKELRRVQMQPLSAVTLSHLQSFLCCRNWGKDDIRQVIAQAVRLQAGRIQPQILLQQQQQQPQPQPQQLCKQGDSDNKDNEQWKEEPHLIEAAKKDDAIDFWGESTQPHTVDGASASSSSPTDTHQQHGTGTIDVGEKSHEAAVMKAERELSRWSLQRAFAQQLNAATSAAGNGDVHPSENGMTPHPAVVSSQHSSIRPRSREELLQQFTLDKYERNLLSNVVFPHEIDVSYADIGGLDQVKKLLRQSITYPLKYPDLYSEGIAREAVKGVLLFGPPGTGKTLLAKAVATEGGASFINVDASTIENKWLGESEKNARAVFSLARKLAPCVVFFDEVDSLLSSREHGTDDTSAHGTLTSVKTTLMAEWDGLTSHLTQSSSPADSSAGGATHHQHHNGNNNNMDNLPLDGGDSAVGTELLLDLNAATFADIDSLFFSPSAELDAASVSALLCDNHRPALATGSCAPVSGNMSSGTSKGTKQPNKSKQNRVIVIASTNRPFDLDEAVLRRLPRRIFVDLPDLATRQAILAVNLAHNNVDFNSVNLTEIAMRLEGFTGSDIKEICREAVVTIAHEQAEQFEQQQQQQQTLATNGNQWGNILREEAGDGGGIEGDAQDRGLRPLTARDLYRAMRRLRASVNENGRELQKVIEWNEKYGEFRQDNAHVEGHGESNASNASLSGYPIGSSAGSGGRGRGRRTELYL